MNHKKIYIIGIGMDGTATLTQEAQCAIAGAEVLIGANRMLSCFQSLGKPVYCSYQKDDIAQFIADCDYETIAVLMSGDCGFYSGAETLLPLLEAQKAYEISVLSGISSPIYFCSKLKQPWQTLHFVSLHGTHANIVRNVCTHERTFFLLGGAIQAKDVCKKLCAYGLEHVTVYIGENLAQQDECIRSGTASDFTALETANLCVMLVRNPWYETRIPSGISDDAFVRGKVPMTKAEVRSLCVAKLGIEKNSICWDIGCGTGSISVEMGLQCPDGAVYAVDRNPEAIALTEQNCRNFRCDHVTILQNDAAAAVAELPAADCVCVGGSGGSLKPILCAAYAKNPSVTIVIPAISLETLEEGRTCLDALGFCVEITQIAVTRTKHIGTHTMLSAENPIYLIKGSDAT